jgi:3-oxoacyl-(acyl-carrier-protein) synthase
MALHTQMIPPTVNFSQCEDGYELGFLGEAQQRQIEYAVSGAFAIGGQSAAIVLKRYEA